MEIFFATTALKKDNGTDDPAVKARKVERVGGRLQNTVIYTFPAVSQFWTYNPEEFLKNPVYSRDFPPCKFCEWVSSLSPPPM